MTLRPAVERVAPPKTPYLLVNRVVRWLLASPRRADRIGRDLLLLPVTGRKTGRIIEVPVAYRPVGAGRLLVLTSSGWRVNLRDRPDVEVMLLGSRRSAVAELVEAPESVAAVYQDLIEELGHARAGRRLGIRINVDRTPTRAELVEAAGRDGLCVVDLQLGERA